MKPVVNPFRSSSSFVSNAKESAPKIAYDPDYKLVVGCQSHQESCPSESL
jgi:hypothetical protein